MTSPDPGDAATRAAPVAIRAATEADRAAVYALRHAVFTVGQGVPPDLERDDRDADALHLVAAEAGGVVATGRLVTRGETGVVGRMAVAASHRGRGLGGAVLAALERAARAAGLAEVELHAQRHAEGFYARAGYVAVGAPYDEAGIAHVTMRKPLPVRRAARDDDSAAVIALIGGCFAEYAGCVLDLPGIDAWMQAPASAYGGEHDRLWLVTLDETVVASAGVKHVGPGTAELKSLYVAASARRRGLGAELVGVVETHAARTGAHTVTLWSDTRFTDAHRLYAGLGYRRGERTRELHDPSETTEYFFAKKLP